MSEAGEEGTYQAVWIDPSWLFWEMKDQAGSYLPRKNAGRAYEIHQHAYDRLSSTPSEFDRVDAITTLRRVVAYRVRTIKETYRLAELQLDAKPKRDLELLSYFGIIRPFMLRRLIDIRNIVEHQDSSPPPASECLMFADIVWYFLRSTDPIVLNKAEVLLFEPPGVDTDSRDHPAVELRFDDEDFSQLPKVHAWLNLSSIAHEYRENWVKIEDAEVIHYQKRNYGPSLPVVRGHVEGNDEQMKFIYDLYFGPHY